MEAVAKFHFLDDTRGTTQGKILKDVKSMDSVPPSLPVLGCKRPRHGGANVSGGGVERKCRL